MSIPGICLDSSFLMASCALSSLSKLKRESTPSTRSESPIVPGLPIVRFELKWQPPTRNIDTSCRSSTRKARSNYAAPLGFPVPSLAPSAGTNRPPAPPPPPRWSSHRVAVRWKPRDIFLPAPLRCPRRHRICHGLEALIPSLPGGHDGSRGSQQRDNRVMSSTAGIPLATLMSSMCSDIGVGGDQVTPTSPAPDCAARPGGATAPVSLLPLPLPLPPAHMVVVALDATRNHQDDEIWTALTGILERGDILRGGDSLLVLGVLHTITHPLGYQTKAHLDCFAGTSSRYFTDQLVKIAELYQDKLHKYAEEAHKIGISVTLKISLGAPAKVVITQEVNSSKAAWVVLDRYFRRDFRHLEKHIACKVAAFQDNLQVQALKSIRTNPSSKTLAEVTKLRRFAITLNLSSKTPDSDIDSVSIRSPPRSFHVPLSNHKIDESSSSVVSVLPPTVNDAESLSNGKCIEASMTSRYDSSERAVLCTGCGLRSVLYIAKFSSSEIQAATSDFSNENLLGEGEFGHMYKGQLKDGQAIAAKLCNNASSKDYTEFFSELRVHSLFGTEISLDCLGIATKKATVSWCMNTYATIPSIDKTATLLEWHKRHAIALGIAKALRYLHEQCCAGPIIVGNLRLDNVLLTHDFVPMLGDFSLPKWNAGNGSRITRIPKQSGYLAPEFAQSGTVSVRTDVYAFGIALFQLISGRKVFDENGGQCRHILRWAEPLVESLALQELIDDRINDTYDTYELYHLAKAAYLCVRANPEQRPSMGEVVRLIETENHSRDLSRQFIPHFMK